MMVTEGKSYTAPVELILVLKKKGTHFNNLDKVWRRNFKKITCDLLYKLVTFIESSVVKL